MGSTSRDRCRARRRRPGYSGPATARAPPSQQAATAIPPCQNPGRSGYSPGRPTGTADAPPAEPSGCRCRACLRCASCGQRNHPWSSRSTANKPRSRVAARGDQCVGAQSRTGTPGLHAVEEHRAPSSLCGHGHDGLRRLRGPHAPQLSRFRQSGRRARPGLPRVRVGLGQSARDHVASRPARPASTIAPSARSGQREVQLAASSQRRTSSRVMRRLPPGSLRTDPAQMVRETPGARPFWRAEVVTDSRSSRWMHEMVRLERSTRSTSSPVARARIRRRCQ